MADFSGTPLSGNSPLSVTFTDLSTNTPTGWAWEKNDGGGWAAFSGTPTAQNPTESFGDGTWSVRLAASNAGGSDSETKADYVESLHVFTPGDLASLVRAVVAEGQAYSDTDPVGLATGAYGTGEDFTASGSTRPTFSANATPAGTAAFDFDGTDDRLDFTSTGALTQWHLFFVIKFDVTTGTHAYISGPNSNIFGVVQSDAATSDQAIDNAVGSIPALVYGGSPKDTDWHLVEFIYDGATMTAVRDGVTLDTDAASGSYTFSALADWAAGGAAFNGKVAEALVCNAPVTGGDLTNVRSYLTAQHLTP